MIKGIDVGYTYTKDESKNIFKSAFTKDENVVGNSIKLNYNDEVFYVGDGNTTIDLDKAENEINKICILASLGLSNSDEYFIVSGLPISQYKLQKEKLKNFILKLDRSHICVNDIFDRIIRIRDVMIFPQGAAALYSQSIAGDALIVDIGGRTIDVALVEMQNGSPKLQQNDTWYNGMLVLYSEIINVVNRKFELTLDPRYAEKILSQGLEIYGVKQNIDFLQPVLQRHFDTMFKQIMLNYPHKTTPIYLCGGGSKLLYNAFKNRFPNVSIFNDYQFSNAIGYYNIGKKAFSKYERSVSVWQASKNA